jgi:CheY-like chemotaxis protein
MPSVLVVDDDRPVRVLLCTLLRREGYDVEDATDGREALLVLASRCFDVIILDLMMPVISGYEVLDHLATMHPDKRNVIVCTAVSERKTKTINSTVVALIIRKPFDITELLGQVRALILRLQRLDPPPDPPTAGEVLS